MLEYASESFEHQVQKSLRRFLFLEHFDDVFAEEVLDLREALIEPVFGETGEEEVDVFETGLVSVCNQFGEQRTHLFSQHSSKLLLRQHKQVRFLEQVGQDRQRKRTLSRLQKLHQHLERGGDGFPEMHCLELVSVLLLRQFYMFLLAVNST